MAVLTVATYALAIFVSGMCAGMVVERRIAARVWRRAAARSARDLEAEAVELIRWSNRRRAERGLPPLLDLDERGDDRG